MQLQSTCLQLAKSEQATGEHSPSPIPHPTSVSHQSKKKTSQERNSFTQDNWILLRDSSMLASLFLLSSTEPELMDIQRAHFPGKSKFQVCSWEECIVCLVFTLRPLSLFLWPYKELSTAGRTRECSTACSAPLDLRLCLSLLEIQ